LQRLIANRQRFRQHAAGSVRGQPIHGVLADARQLAELAEAPVIEVKVTLIIMAGTMQQFWKHEVPKTTENVGERINLTFRLIGEA
jgi:hypothetical protein